MKPIVAIVGRANVGKSRMFNRLAGAERAIVHDRPGITRDRHYAPAEWAGHEFVVVDTGGLELESTAELERKVTSQSLAAVNEADVVVCLFDGHTPPTAEDDDIVRVLRRAAKPVVWVINKIDDARREMSAADFARLGVGEMILVSAEHGRCIDELLDAVIARFPERGAAPAERPGLTVGMVGRPNVGKSTLINRLAGSDRVVAHELPGTTRDAIDVEIAFEGKDYVFVDTAGVKRHWKSSERVEKFTAMRSLRSIERSRIVCLLIDGAEGFNKHDVKLASFVLEDGKGLIIVINKWDMVQSEWHEYESTVRHRLGQLGAVPVIAVSATTGYRCLKLFDEINRIDRKLGARLSTSEVNRVIGRSLEEHHLPTYRGREVRIYYATQTGVYPPTFTLFANYPAAVPYAYRRYLIKRLQKALGAEEVPVRIICRTRT